MNKMYKLLFFMTLISGTMISISSSSWLGVWMGMEINLISFIPLISNEKNNFSSESSMKYFIVQALASTVLLFSILLLMLNKYNVMTIIFIMMNSALFLKMGAAPFHFWFPEVLSKMNWNQSMILLTWQKIAPMMIISYSIKMNNFTTMIILLSALVGSIMGLNQTMIQKLMAYSSINHMSWMISAMMIKENIWLVYFIIYSLITLSITTMMNEIKSFHMKQMFLLMNNNPLMKFFFIINFLSLGGLPPFIGFFPKWIIIVSMIEQNLLILTFLMIMFTLITLFFYLRMTFSMISINMNENKWNKNININKMTTTMMSSISISGMIISTILVNYI
uniref:NADH-ubiquinone oxidoreductase chain 2 n=1 Tax=Scirtes orbicularis TaxID=1588440 RepID=A0A343C3Q7_9COLE|nr:NADH dehydrogenase subunit 2 [Scirtes orbicularis]